MRKKWKPTREEVRAIKEAAAAEGYGLAYGAVILEPGIRYNVEDDSKNPDRGMGEMNVRLVSDDEDWNDTDLADFGAWKDFRDGVELTEDGRATVDFYIYSRSTDEGLLGNVTVDYAGGKVVRIYGYGRGAEDYPLPTY